MQFHNHDRQLISLCEIQKWHAAKHVMQPETAPNRVPSNLAAKMQQNAAQKVMQLALVAYGRIAYATQQS